ncbi:class I SAM-dependent methyltransferase [Saccharicrinis sp. FJH62]|uniref:class I SAM-dependent methyltransferase n=1 Tax=Saccharicrinis sp. FJH62 TaxID=3344657 RepID=UPI0035D45EF8
MSNDTNSIHDFDVNLIVEYYSGTERQGPGSPEMTLKALSFLEHLPDEPEIADLGCGTGGQTMVLAQHTGGKITGVDLFPSFVNLFNRNAEALHLQNRVKGIVGSMDDLSFEPESLDLIWSEGSIYNIGFEKGLQYWRRFLKNDGYVVVSEASWFTNERPAEIDDFWMDAYPGIDTVPNKLAQMQKAGYFPVAAFVLPVNCWTEHFYDQQVQPRENFLKNHAGNIFAEGFIATERHQETLYRKYNQYYGYAFYIGRKF